MALVAACVLPDHPRSAGLSIVIAVMTRQKVTPD
jgi:hypothetical protein